MQELQTRFGTGSVSEVEVFHGTRKQIIGTIISDGFDAGKNVRSAFGKGIYFSNSANMSKDYSDVPEDGVSYMIISSMLVGPVVLGSSCFTIDTNLYTAAVDRITSPSIYVCPKNEYAVPRYVVAFHKNAN